MAQDAIANSQIKEVVDRYDRLRVEREERGKAFLEGRRPYMIFQTLDGNVWGNVRTTEQCFRLNFEYVAGSLDIPSDHLPVLEPWFGTGVYANIYGCPYVWMDDEAPATRYKYGGLEEIRNVRRPRWEDSEIAQLVLQTIRYFKSKTGDSLPIVWTDTQNASDTATLIADMCQVIIGCMTEPETVMAFMRQINEVIIEFSRVQAELIGDALIMPGHIMLSNAGFSGMSISDDNLAVLSPDVNVRFNLPLDDEIGRAMGGVAIHSCGNWSHTMGLIRRHCPSCVAIDCAVDHEMDPNPNDPVVVRDAMAGTGIAVNVRMGPETDRMVETVRRLLHPDIKLIVHVVPRNPEEAERNYYTLDSMLAEYFAGTAAAERPQDGI